MARTRPKSKPAVSRAQAEAAVQTLLRWAGEDPQREGLRDTPKRVVDAYGDWFSGYSIDPGEYMQRTFEEVEGYDEMVVLRDIAFESFCEHHMAPIIGRAHVGYLPTDRVVGISKLASVVEGYARRLQVQEKLTAQIAECINEVLKPRGVGVVDRCRAPVHDDARRAQARRFDGDQQDARGVPQPIPERARNSCASSTSNARSRSDPCSAAAGPERGSDPRGHGAIPRRPGRPDKVDLGVRGLP